MRNSLERCRIILESEGEENIVDKEHQSCASISSATSSCNEHLGDHSEQVLQSHDLRYSGHLRNVHLKFMTNPASRDPKKIGGTTRRVQEWSRVTFVSSYNTAKVFRGPILCSVAFIILIPVHYSLLVSAVSLPMIILSCGVLLTAFDISRQCQRLFMACQIFIIRWVNDNLILDDVLSAIVQNIKQLTLGVASVFGMYSLPLSQQRRVEVIDSIFPTERFGDQRLTVSQILTNRGGALALLPSKFYREILMQSDSGELVEHEALSHDDASLAMLEEDLVWDGPQFLPNLDTHMDEVKAYGKKQTTQVSIAPYTSNLCFDIAKDCMPDWVKNLLLIKVEALNRIGMTAFLGLLIHLRSSMFARRTFSNLLHAAGVLGFSGTMLTACSMVSLKRCVHNSQDQKPSTVVKEEAVELEKLNRSPPSAGAMAENEPPDQDHSMRLDNQPQPPEPKIWMLLRLLANLRSGHYSRHLQVGLAVFVLALMKRRLLFRRSKCSR